LLARGLEPRREAIVRENLALALKRLGQPEAAAAELESVLALAPGRRSTRLMQAQLLRAAGEPARALEIVQGMLSNAGGDGAAAEVRAGPAALHVLAGECRLDMGDLEAAGAAVTASRTADPSYVGSANLAMRIKGVAHRLAPAGESISAVLIVRDVADQIAACLDSLADAVDEIVVVDTGSTDGTPAVVSAAGARVVEFTWRDDFAAARNVSIDAARGDWVLVIDADECLMPDSAALVRQVVTAGELDAARVVIDSPTLAGDPLARQRERSIRLFRRLPGVRYIRPVHEQIEPALAAIGARVGDTEIAILHHGYADPAEHAAKSQRNLRLMRAELEQRGGAADGLLAFHYGLTLIGIGRDREGIEALETAIEPVRQLNPDLAAHAHARLAQAQLRLGDPVAATFHIEESLAARPTNLFSRYVAAGCRFNQGDAVWAAGILEDLLASPECAAVLRPGLVLLDLGDAWSAAGDAAAAARAFVAAAGHLPDDPRPAERLRHITHVRRVS